MQGTSRQALKYALENFDRTYIVNANGSTFHPKLYMFYGSSKAVIYYGSSNFTVGGLETNFEGGIILRLDLPEDKFILEQAQDIFTALLPENLSCSVQLTQEILDKLCGCHVLLDESLPRRGKSTRRTVSSELKRTGDSKLSAVFGSYKTKSPKSIPGSVFKSNASGAVRKKESDRSAEIANGIVMQVIPHPNGEIHLSMIAIKQNPNFFGYPFSGETTPKKTSNAAYPQRIPDPVVNIEVYDSRGKLVHAEEMYNLNMVEYIKKSEIRITITPNILAGITAEAADTYPILVMSQSLAPSCDYNMLFYAPGSAEYMMFENMCDQKLPSGGKPVGRKMGWF